MNNSVFGLRHFTFCEDRSEASAALCLRCCRGDSAGKDYQCVCFITTCIGWTLTEQLGPSVSERRGNIRSYSTKFLVVAVLFPKSSRARGSSSTLSEAVFSLCSDMGGLSQIESRGVQMQNEVISVQKKRDNNTTLQCNCYLNRNLWKYVKWSSIGLVGKATTLFSPCFNK